MRTTTGFPADNGPGRAGISAESSAFVNPLTKAWHTDRVPATRGRRMPPDHPGHSFV
jgi:hypothetical protein